MPLPDWLPALAPRLVEAGVVAGCGSPDDCLLRWGFAVAKAAVCFLTGAGC